MDSGDIGKKGEEITVSFLVGKRHKILDRNYRMKFGEIDIVSKRDKTLYFTEVKTFVREGEGNQDKYRVEERVNRAKMEKLSRVVEFYLLSKYSDLEIEWEFWVIAVSLDVKNKKAFVKVIPEILSR